MPVPRMNDVSWSNGQGMLHGVGPGSTGQDLTSTAGAVGSRHQHSSIGSRSQDDATVGYFFQRPQNESNMEFNTYGNKKWAIGDDSVIEQVNNP